MNTNEYFIYLLNCHLNGAAPIGEKNADWNTIYELANRHSVIPIISRELNKLPEASLPDDNIILKFNENFAYTVQKYSFKMKSLSSFITALSNAKIPHLIIKGTVLRNIYPMAQLRTSRDTDVIVRPSDFFDALDVLKSTGFIVDLASHDVATVKVGSEIFELNTQLENINIQSKIYFSTPFDDISDCSGYTYKLKPAYHLLYIITHIAHHLKVGGAGIKMIMDIDVLIRNYPDINIREFLELCDNIKIRKTSEALIALSKKWFKTPVAINFTFEDKENEQLLTSLSSLILDCGKAENYLKNQPAKSSGFLNFLFSSKAAESEVTGVQKQILKELEIN